MTIWNMLFKGYWSRHSRNIWFDTMFWFYGHMGFYRGICPGVIIRMILFIFKMICFGDTLRVWNSSAYCKLATWNNMHIYIICDLAIYIKYRERVIHQVRPEWCVCWHKQLQMYNVLLQQYRWSRYPLTRRVKATLVTWEFTHDPTSTFYISIATIIYLYDPFVYVI